MSEIKKENTELASEPINDEELENVTGGFLDSLFDPCKHSYSTVCEKELLADKPCTHFRTSYVRCENMDGRAGVVYKYECAIGRFPAFEKKTKTMWPWDDRLNK